MIRPSDGPPPGRPRLDKWRSGPAAVAPGNIAVGRVKGVWRDTARLVVESLTDFDERFQPGQRLWARGHEYIIAWSEQRKGQYFLAFEGLDSFDEAVALSGQYLEVPESDAHALAPDTYFEHQIVGLHVRTTEGRELGTVTEVLHTGSNDVYVVETNGKPLLIPAVDDVVLTIDMEAHVMVIELIDGLLEP